MIKFKKSVLFVFRNLYILPVAEKFAATKSILSNLKRNKEFCKEHPNLRLPPPYLMFDAYSYTSYPFYIEYGLAHANLINEIIEKYYDLNNITVCEWGCGPARILRHLKSDKISKLKGFDYNVKTIEWCKNSFSHIEFKQNKISPPLDLEDNSIDVLYCCSVFTHLSEEQHFLWIDEIKRVLKPKGLFIGTFHGDNCVQGLLPYELERLNNDGIIVREKVKEGSRLFLAYENDSFIKTRLLKDFTNIKKIDSKGTMQQTIWIAYKP